jgi:hypothetical protein
MQAGTFALKAPPPVMQPVPCAPPGSPPALAAKAGSQPQLHIEDCPGPKSAVFSRQALCASSRTRRTEPIDCGERCGRVNAAGGRGRRQRLRWSATLPAAAAAVADG